jgi:putative restriction endonuclease
MAESRTGVKWNREETILAFDLYCRTPFGKIRANNPDINELANLLGRTPGSVALKMSNLAHFDPELRLRNVSGMAHGSKLDAEISEEFAKNWTGLSYQAQIIRAKLQGEDISKLVDLGDVTEIPAGKYREQVMKARVGQHFFRMSVLNSYGNKCCITGMKNPELLIASHIKPWDVSNEFTERTNPSNGLCLNPFHDKAFDRGFITIDKRYKVIISQQIKEVTMDSETREWFMGYEGKQIILPEKFLPGKDFIEYHNDVIFQG